jgi:hypothetical protein
MARNVVLPAPLAPRIGDAAMLKIKIKTEQYLRAAIKGIELSNLEQLGHRVVTFAGAVFLGGAKIGFDNAGFDCTAAGALQLFGTKVEDNNMVRDAITRPMWCSTSRTVMFNRVLTILIVSAKLASSS